MSHLVGSAEEEADDAFALCNCKRLPAIGSLLYPNVDQSNLMIIKKDRQTFTREKDKGKSSTQVEKKVFTWMPVLLFS